ncbi:GNAT family N-acetyltransferase [Paenibacillus sp. T1]|uniref:GNAT family N-acetyltransferase n=1 Tax=Paenibacillus glycinis TaxID=2697035 RepID=A0ABW9XL38_9BACL|nr:GNAT family N-acetyltransferase [Paenibacillus glycinis]
MFIRLLQPGDRAVFRQLRQRAIEEHPESFSSSSEELSDAPELLIASDHVSRFVVGAFAENGDLIGIVGFKQESLMKFRHKGVIWGMYVDKSWQGKGIAKRLLARLIECVETTTEVEQLNLAVAESNEGAKRLYESFGFVTYGLEINAMKLKDRTFVNGEYMTKQLARSRVAAGDGMQKPLFTS